MTRLNKTHGTMSARADFGCLPAAAIYLSSSFDRDGPVAAGSARGFVDGSSEREEEEDS